MQFPWPRFDCCWTWFVLGSLIVSVTPVSAADPPPKVPLATETFDAAWKLIKDRHYDAKLNGVDWDAVKTELRPKAESAETTGELRAVIRAMLARLQESHFALLPGDLADTLQKKSPTESTKTGEGSVGIHARLVAEGAVVDRVDPGSVAEAAGIKPGWLIDKIDGVDLAEQLDKLRKELDKRKLALMASRLIDNQLSGPPGKSVTVSLRDGADQPHEVVLSRQALTGEYAGLGNLPPVLTRIDISKKTLPTGQKVAIIRFNIWLIPIMAKLEQTFGEIEDCQAVVIDLRGNPGGIAGLAAGVAGYLVDSPTRPVIGTMKMRGTELKLNIMPRRTDSKGGRRRPFAGPLAILTDGGSASTSEFFAGGLQVLGRAYVFGETTAGAALPSVMEKLPNGDVLQHAIADFVLANGERVEGKGVIPNVPVTVDRKTLLTGTDPIQQAALDWIAKTVSKP